MADNLYLVLGVSRDADPTQIRSAYRRLVRAYHPDVTGGSAEDFVDVRRAYETLSDPQARSHHDAELDAATCRRVPVRRVPRPPPSRCYDSIDELVGGWVPGIYRRGRQTSRRKDLYVELVLSHDEASGGGVLPLKIPLHVDCPECHGAGYVGRFSCRTCDGGAVAHHEIRVAVPPGVVDGLRARLALDDVGLPDVWLNVLVLVR